MPNIQSLYAMLDHIQTSIPIQVNQVANLAVYHQVNAYEDAQLIVDHVFLNIPSNIPSLMINLYPVFATPNSSAICLVFNNICPSTYLCLSSALIIHSITLDIPVSPSFTFGMINTCTGA